MSRSEDDYIAGELARIDAAARQRAEAEKRIREDLERARRAALPRITLDEDQVSFVLRVMSDARVLAEQMVADYLKLTPTHRRRLQALATDLTEAQRQVASAPITIPAAAPAPTADPATADHRRERAPAKGRRPRRKAESGR